jgi:NifB/MoaA-like Fe-S oxidoreductase
VDDLYEFRDQIISLAIVPVGLTDHRFGLAHLQKVDPPYAAALLGSVDRWQAIFRAETGRGFVYASDEFYIVAGRPLPSTALYDGFPQVENGVGLVRSFITDFRRQARSFPARLPSRRRLTMVTAELAAGFIAGIVVPRLERIGGLTVRLIVAPNVLYGRSVTVAGLLSGKCLYSSLEGGDCGDMVLLPPDILNADGLLLDDETLPRVQERLRVPVMVFDGRWSDVLGQLKHTKGTSDYTRLLPSSTVAASKHRLPGV